MIIFLGIVTAAAGQVDGAAALANLPTVYEAEFKPLLKSERRFAVLGPAGPFYPEVAVQAQKDGEANLECVTAPMGVLKKCKAISEAPVGYFFSAAARVMAERGRITAAPMVPQGQTIRVHVPFTRYAPTAIAP